MTTFNVPALSITSGLARAASGVPTAVDITRTSQYRVLQPRVKLYLVRTCCVTYVSASRLCSVHSKAIIVPMAVVTIERPEHYTTIMKPPLKLPPNMAADSLR